MGILQTILFTHANVRLYIFVIGVVSQVPEGCNGYIAAPAGHITSPGFPEGVVYRSNTDCVWTIVNKAGRIQLSFTNIQMYTPLPSSTNVLQVC